tara:strand:- start:4941 stop:5363 length:423 start_codon:yes stop_codon:yes gene_type:complete
MYIALMGCAQQGSSTPLAASFTATSDIAESIDVATGSIVTFTTNAGELDVTINPTGGSGSYTFNWIVGKTAENSDNGNRFSIASTGTTNTARYNTLTINGARPAGSGNIFDAEFTATCTVDDGSSQVNVDVPFIVNGLSL